MSVKQALQKAAFKIGARLVSKAGYTVYSAAPNSQELHRRRQLFESYQIDTVLDVGANTGQFALQLRQDLQYTGRILSFEPIASSFETLQKNAKRDRLWQVYHCALGEQDGEQVINVAVNSVSSSLLGMLPRHEQTAPDSRYVRQERIGVRRLDSIAGELLEPGGKVYLKIDTQGYENAVINGALKTLHQIDTIQMEMSLVPLYQGETLFAEMLDRMSGLGYSLMTIEHGHIDPQSQQLLQVDGIFHRLTAP